MTNEEKRKIYAALAAPFPEHCIQRTEGRITGRGYDTSGIGYQFIANRLNEVLGVGGWRAHRVVNVKEVTRSNGRPAFEAIADITLELGSWGLTWSALARLNRRGQGGRFPFAHRDAHASTGAAGNPTWNVEPLPTSLWTEMVPPWAVAMAWQIARPSPVLRSGPIGRVVKNGSKMRPRTSGAMPTP